jgi:hypothetical protein
MNSSEYSVSQTRSRSQSRSTSRSSGTYYRSRSMGPSKLSMFQIDLGNCKIYSFLLALNNLYIYRYICLLKLFQTIFLQTASLEDLEIPDQDTINE